MESNFIEPNDDQIKILATFGSQLSFEMMTLFAEKVIEFKNKNPEVTDFIPRTASMSALIGVISLISKTGVFDEATVHELINDTFTNIKTFEVQNGRPN